MRSGAFHLAAALAFLSSAPAFPDPADAFSAAAPAPDLHTLLDQPAKPLTSEKSSLPTLFYTIGRTYGITVTVDPAVTGTASLRFNGGTLRQLLATLLEANDLFMEEKDGVLAINRVRTEFYLIEYAEISRSASSSTSVSLSPSQNAGPAGYSGIGAQVALPNGGNAGAIGQPGSAGSGSTSFSISEKSDDSFWGSIENDIKAQKREYERIAINRFGGIATIETTARRHRFWSAYFKLLNERINAQVLVEVRIDEITLNSAHAFGVNWTQVQASMGGASSGSAASSTAISTLAGAALPASSFLGNFASGKLSAVLSALQDQGSVKTIATPSIRLLNNQKGFVKVGEDRTFYSLYSNVTINQAGAVAPQTTSQNIYLGQQQTFGVVLPVTAQVGRDGWVTLIMEPARTQLNGVDTSPDNTQTAPDTNDQSISTMLRLRDGESAILGGLVTRAESKQTNGVPFLSSIPLLGQFTRTDASSSSKDELVLTVSVHIIK